MSIVFPYNMGPSIRKFGTSLLYEGKLVVRMPGWLQREVLQSFFEMGDMVHRDNHFLKQVFAIAAHYLELTQIQVIAETKELSGLGNYITKAMMVYSGTPEHYEQWQPFQKVAFTVLSPHLNDPQMLNVASTEFVWRVYESFLLSDRSTARALESLSTHAMTLPDPRFILLECMLNRFTVIQATRQKKNAALSITTDLPSVVALAEEWGKGEGEDVALADLRAETLAFTLFDSLLSEHVPIVDARNAAALATLLESRASELQSLRSKCKTEGMALVEGVPDSARLRSAIEDAFGRMKSDLQDFLAVDANAVKQLVNSLLEDDKLWAIAGGIIGTVTLGVPQLVTAAMGVTAFSRLGAKAVKANRLRRESIKNSPWSFVYYLRKNT